MVRSGIIAELARHVTEQLNYRALPDRKNMTHTLALDLEGTLISNAMSCFPRPGLHDFLTWCEATFPRVVLFTAVKSERVRSILDALATEGAAPAWFRDIEIVDWDGDHKDLRFIKGAEASRAFLVDDIEAYVHPEQHAQWVPIAAFASPYPDTDRELERIQEVLTDAIRVVL